MKKKLIISAIGIILGSTAMASSSKICFGSTKSDDSKGIILTAQITPQEITFKTIKGDSYNGTFPTYNTSVKGRDGKTYLNYRGYDYDYQEVIMVDQILLQNSTTGLIQFRARGEGFFNSVFVCKDAKK